MKSVFGFGLLLLIAKWLSKGDSMKHWEVVKVLGSEWSVRLNGTEVCVIDLCPSARTPDAVNRLIAASIVALLQRVAP